MVTLSKDPIVCDQRDVDASKMPHIANICNAQNTGNKFLIEHWTAGMRKWFSNVVIN